MSRVPAFATWCALLAMTVWHGCAMAPETLQLPEETAVSLKKYRKEYVISPGDQFEILVHRAPEVSRTVVVRPDGMITVPTLGDVRAAGLSFAEFDKELTERLSRRLQNPEVDVIATDIPPAVVYVVGEAVAPRPVPLRTARTAAEALAQTGGFRMVARRGAYLIRLLEDGHMAAIPLRPSKSGDAAAYLTLEATLLRADDIIVVPESSRSKFVRLIDDFVNKPLSGLNSMLGLYVNYKLTEQLDASIDQINAPR